MKASTFLAKLRDQDIRVWADGDRLRCSAPPGVLTPELREELRGHKAEVLEFLQSAGSLARQHHAIVPLQPQGSGTPIFAFGGHNGDVFCFRALAQQLGDDQPFFGLQPPGLDGAREPIAGIEELAAYFATAIREFRPEGPYAIAGYCAGGTIAFELARQLVNDGAAVSILALFGAPYPTSYRRLQRLRLRLGNQAGRLVKHARALAALSPRNAGLYLKERLRARKEAHRAERPAEPDPVLVHRRRVANATFAALRRYIPGHFEGRLSLILQCRDWVRSVEKPLRWRTAALHTEEFYGPDGCSGDMMLREPYAPVFAELFKRCGAGRLNCESDSRRRPSEERAETGFAGLPPRP